MFVVSVLYELYEKWIFISYLVLGELIGGDIMKNQARKCMLTKSGLFVLLFLIFGVTLFGVIGISAMHPDRIAASSVSVQPREKIITRVLINKDDTLWSYACQYYSKEYESVEEFISEIKRTNGLSSDVIKEGYYLLIPHYVTVEPEKYLR